MKLATAYGGAVARYFDEHVDTLTTLRAMFTAQPSTSTTESTMPHPIGPSHVLFQPGTAIPRAPLAADPDRTAVAPGLPAQVSDYRPPRPARPVAAHASPMPWWAHALIAFAGGITGGMVFVALVWVMTR